MGKIYVGKWNKAELIPKDRNIYIVGEKIEGTELNPKRLAVLIDGITTGKYKHIGKV